MKRMWRDTEMSKILDPQTFMQNGVKLINGQGPEECMRRREPKAGRTAKYLWNRETEQIEEPGNCRRVIQQPQPNWSVLLRQRKSWTKLEPNRKSESKNPEEPDELQGNNSEILKAPKKQAKCYMKQQRFICIKTNLSSGSTNIFQQCSWNG